MAGGRPAHTGGAVLPPQTTSPARNARTARASAQWAAAHNGAQNTQRRGVVKRGVSGRSAASRPPSCACPASDWPLSRPIDADQIQPMLQQVMSISSAASRMPRAPRRWYDATLPAGRTRRRGQNWLRKRTSRIRIGRRAAGARCPGTARPLCARAQPDRGASAPSYPRRRLHCPDRCVMLSAHRAHSHHAFRRDICPSGLQGPSARL